MTALEQKYLLCSTKCFICTPKILPLDFVVYSRKANLARGYLTLRIAGNEFFFMKASKCIVGITSLWLLISGTQDPATFIQDYFILTKFDILEYYSWHCPWCEVKNFFLH